MYKFWVLILSQGKLHWFGGSGFDAAFDEAHAAFPDDNTHIFVFISDEHSRIVNGELTGEFIKELNLVKESS